MKPRRWSVRYSAAVFSGVPGMVCCTNRITKLATPTCAPTYRNCATTPRRRCVCVQIGRSPGSRNDPGLPGLRPLFRDFGQMRAPEHDRHHEKDAGNHQVRPAQHAGFHRAVGLEVGRRHRGDLGGRVLDAAQDERRADDRRDHRTQRVEGLRGIQPPRRRLRRAERRHVRVGADFEEALPAGHHEERAQEQADTRGPTAAGMNSAAPAAQTSEPGHDAAAVPDAPHEPAGRQGRQEVAAEERRLNQRRLKVRQAEQLLEVRNEDVVEVDAQRPQEEEGRDEDERQDVASLGEWRA